MSDPTNDGAMRDDPKGGGERWEDQPAGEPPLRMTALYLGLLRKGPAWTAKMTPELEQAQREHLALLQRLGHAGDLLLAGPAPNGEDVRGFVLCRGDSAAAVRALFADDPHLRAERLVLELHPWLVPTELLEQPLLRRGADLA